MENCSKKLKFYLFADDTNLLYLGKTLKSLEKFVNEELCHLYDWLCSNKLSLNFKKTNYVIFHPYKKNPAYPQVIKMFYNKANAYAEHNYNDHIKYLGFQWIKIFHGSII